MRRRQLREPRIGLERALVDEAHAGVQHAASRCMLFVPGGKGRHDEARVGGFQRRVRSSVSRTRSTVSGGSSASGTATTPFPRFFKVIGVRDAGESYDR